MIILIKRSIFKINKMDLMGIMKIAHYFEGSGGILNIL
jgi:hypothetical protein